MQQVLQGENAEATELLARESLLFSFSIEVAYAVYKFRSQPDCCNKCCEWPGKTITGLKL